MPKRDNSRDPKVIRALRDYRLALIAREDAQLERLAHHWMVIENGLADEMALLALQIQEAKEAGHVITEQLIARMSRYQQLDKQMKAQILKYAKSVALPDIEAEQWEYGNMALSASADAIKAQFDFAPAFDFLSSDHIETYVGMAGDGSPLYDLLKEAYPQSLDGVIKALLDGSARGLNPNQVAYKMAQNMGMGLERITLIARTEQLRVNRLVSADQYRASELPGHMKRVATKDDRACMACLVSDGEIIPLNEELDDHPRGRCVAIFQVKGSPEIDWEKGPQWFEKQSEDLQREMMGDKKYELWKAGAYDLEDLRRTNYNPIWGNNPREATIEELLNGKDYNDFIPKVPKAPRPPKPKPIKIIEPSSDETPSSAWQNNLTPSSRSSSPLLQSRSSSPPTSLSSAAAREESEQAEFLAGQIEQSERQSINGIRVVSNESHHQKGAFQSERVTILGNGDAILKTNTSGWSTWGDFDSKQGFARREVMAYNLDQALGLNIVPKTVPFIEKIGEKNIYNSLQSWAENATIGERVRDGVLKELDSPGKVGLLDMVLGNGDRHTQNWLLGSDGAIVAIDNGLAMMSTSTSIDMNYFFNSVKRSFANRDDFMDLQDNRFKLSSAYKAALQGALDDGTLEDLFENITTGNDSADKKLAEAGLERAEELLDSWDTFFYD